MTLSRYFLGAALLFILLSAGCRSGSAFPSPSAVLPERGIQPLHYSGRGPASLSIGPWRGTGVLHITAGEGSQPFILTVKDGLSRPTLVEQPAPLDEYRAWTFTTAGPLVVEIQADAGWEITLLPPTREYFPTLRVPGTYRGQGSAVILLDGAHSIAIFDTPDLGSLRAWAYPLEGEGEMLAFRTAGDYRGRAVLPKASAWLLVSGGQPWSVEVQPPCCEAAPD